MSDTATTTLSSRGQVVIPEEIRQRLGLETGTQFVVLGEKDVVILKVLQTPDRREYAALVQAAREAARAIGMRREDITKAVTKARRRR